MKKEFLVTKSGTTFVKFAGLLDLAHERNIQSLTTELVQAPNEQNGRVAIFSATATFIDANGEPRSFRCHGTAHPGNVKSHMQVYLLEMAETRSKARVLRDALNIATCSLEEAEGGEIDQAAPAPRTTARTTARKSGCTHCMATDVRPGSHHGPGCPNRTDQRASAVR